MARAPAKELSPVCAYVAQRTGTSLSAQQLARLLTLLEPKLVDRSEQQYLEFLKSSKGQAELADLMNSISVHKTDLFRDEVQLKAFVSHVLDPLVRTVRRPLRFWSAGCATGEEVATLLILMQESGADPGSTILGTDISEPALVQARKLSFHPALFERVPERIRETYFRRNGKELQLIPSLAQRATFLRHNLMDVPYPLAEGAQCFDVIFCRNVLIYFTDASFDRVAKGLSERLAPDGTLVLSAAEPILRPTAGLVTLKCDHAFFYRLATAKPFPGQVQEPSPPPISHTPSRGSIRVDDRPPPRVGRVTEDARKSSHDEKPAAKQGAQLSSTADASRRMQNASAAAVKSHGVHVDDPLAEAAHLFELALDAAAGDVEDDQTEKALRKCLYLDPHLAQARYLLGMLLEQQGAYAEATSEYRRALAALKEGKARQMPFFLNSDRLQKACVAALRRLGQPG